MPFMERYGKILILATVGNAGAQWLNSLELEFYSTF